MTTKTIAATTMERRGTTHETVGIKRRKARVTLHCDNRSAVCLAENQVFHARTKHIEVHYHFIREKVLQGEIHMKLTPTEEQVADIFTKGLSVNKFQDMRRQLGMCSKSALRGSVDGQR